MGTCLPGSPFAFALFVCIVFFTTSGGASLLRILRKIIHIFHLFLCRSSPPPSMGPRTSGVRALVTLAALLSCVSLSKAFVSGRTGPPATSGCRHTALRGQPLSLGRASVSSRPPAPFAASPPRGPTGLRSAGDDSGGDGDGDGDGVLGGENILTLDPAVVKVRCNQ